MKRNMIWLLVSLVVLLVGGVTMLADNAAVVVNETGCWMLDGNGDFVITNNAHAVTTSNGNGSMTCQANVTPSSSGKAAHWEGTASLLCLTPGGATADWKETVSADGQASLSCHINGSDQ